MKTMRIPREMFSSGEYITAQTLQEPDGRPYFICLVCKEGKMFLKRKDDGFQYTYEPCTNCGTDAVTQEEP